MSQTTLLKLVLGGLLVAGVLAQHAWYWPQLPQRVATHFGADGQPDDWMSRTAATVLLAGLQIGLPLFLLGITQLARRLPDSMVNIPHREYWLAPERRESTLLHMDRMMFAIAALTAIFLFVIVHLTFLANRAATSLDTRAFFVAMAMYVAGVFLVAGFSLRKLRLPAGAEADASGRSARS